jgi:hypothetical protein
MLCCGAGWSISKQALEVDELKQAADLANERAAQASGAQQLRQVRLLFMFLAFAVTQMFWALLCCSSPSNVWALLCCLSPLCCVAATTTAFTYATMRLPDQATERQVGERDWGAFCCRSCCDAFLHAAPLFDALLAVCCLSTPFWPAQNAYARQGLNSIFASTAAGGGAGR